VAGLAAKGGRSLSYAEGRIYDVVLLSYFVLVGVEVVDRVEAKAGSV
jgi:hypothetical protein